MIEFFGFELRALRSEKPAAGVYQSGCAAVRALGVVFEVYPLDKDDLMPMWRAVVCFGDGHCVRADASSFAELEPELRRKLRHAAGLMQNIARSNLSDSAEE